MQWFNSIKQVTSKESRNAFAHSAQHRVSNSLYSPLKQRFIAFQFNTKQRTAFYETLMMLLEVGSFSNAIAQMLETYSKHARKYFDNRQVMIEVLKDIQYRHNSLGFSSFDAMRPYLPKTELMMLASAKEIDKTAIENTLSVTRKLSSMKKRISKSLVSPMVNFAAMIGLLMMVHFTLKPVVESTGKMASLAASTKVLFGLSDLIVNQYIVLVLAVIILSIAVIITLPQVTAQWRIVILDKLPVFSIYKKVMMIRFLITLALMLKGNDKNRTSRLPIPESIKSMVRFSNRYLCFFIHRQQQLITQGKSSGEVLTQSGLFAKDTVAMIEMYSKSNQLERGIYALGHDYLDKQIEKMESTFQVINYLFLVGLGAFMAWYAMLIFSLQSAFSG
ncbi:type II secretion system F family protein [Cysteiniphilum halobium]|uniref:type II secretion system F family protein n=1 Tax=Cysteiniphilum halobium TaxID=2219059 RepID=UPI000E657E83|nr:type II secretion system F family protein [Cysteiniphilum halobium]